MGGRQSKQAKAKTRSECSEEFPSPGVPAPADPGLIMGMLADGVKPKIVYVLCRLCLVDKLLPVGTTRKTAEQLAQECEVHAAPLNRVLRIAGQLGLLTEHEDGFSVTPLGSVLADSHPSGVKWFAMLVNLPTHAKSFNFLYEAVQHNKSGLVFATGNENVDPFDILLKDPVEAPVMGKAMNGITAVGLQAVMQFKEWGKYTKVVDVGGCQGTVIKVVLEHYPNVKGFNFDRADVIGSLSPEEGPLAGRLTHVAGDFFQPFPQEVQGADAIVMKHIMHDWGDDLCIKILKNCMAALAPGGKIIIIDHLVPETANVAPGTFPLFPFMLDMYMMSVTNGGCERALSDWIRLFAAAGLTAPELCVVHQGLAILRTQPAA